MANDKSWLDAAPIIRPAVSPEVPRPAAREEPAPTAWGDVAVSPGDMERINASPPPGGTWQNWVDPSIQQSPNAGSILPLSNEPGRGLRLAVPNAVRGLFTEGPRIENGRVVVPGATINPNTGALGVTPEAATAGALIQPNRLLFGGRIGTPGTPVQLGQLTGAIERATPETWRPVVSGEEYVPGRQYRMNQTTGQREILEGGTATPSAAPRGVPEPEAGSPQSAPVAGTPEEIMANAKAVANQHYGIAEKAGLDSGFTPASVNKMVDAVDSVAPQGPGERAVAGQNEVTRLQRDMQALRDKPLTLSDIQLMDEKMSGLITSELRAGREKVANQLRDIQDKWRDQVDNATSVEVTGGVRGFQALDPARQAWSQYRKMQDVMLMQERASMTQNPTTSYKTAVKNFVTSRASRSWSEEEKASLIQSADRGVIGGTLHLLGSRLLPHVGGAVGAGVGGIPGFLVGEVVTHGIGGVARTAANTMQEGRVNRTMGVLANRVPPRLNDLLGPGP